MTSLPADSPLSSGPPGSPLRLPPPDGGVDAAAWDRLWTAAAAAHPVPASLSEPARAAAIAARIVMQVRREEGVVGAPRAASSRPTPTTSRWAALWPRVLVVSLCAHAILLGVLALSARVRPAPEVEPFVVATGFSSAPSEGGLGALPLPERSSFDGAMFDRQPFGIDERDLPDPASRLPDDFDAAGREAEFLRPAAPLSASAISLRTGSPAFRARTDTAVKRAIELRLDIGGTSKAVHRSLAALAARQRPDGTFPGAAPDPEGRTSAVVALDPSDATAWALLPFLGDGNCSAFGPHRDVVARGVAALRARRGSDGVPVGGSVVLWALAEDQWLAGGFRTPAENRDRATDLRALAARLQTSPTVLGTSASETDDSLRTTALAAAARARVVEAPAATVLAAHTLDEWLVVAVTPDTAFVRGAAVAASGDLPTFRRWTKRAASALNAVLAPDGLAQVPVELQASRELDGLRVLRTARTVLGLQVPFRLE